MVVLEWSGCFRVRDTVLGMGDFVVSMDCYISGTK